MQEQEILRLEHYCHLLHLNRWDKNDIINYVSAHKFYTEGKCLQETYIRALNKIKKLDLYHVATSFEHYLMKEASLYQQLHEEYPDKSDRAILEQIYKQIDREIELEILYSKQVATQENVSKAKNIGCMLLIILLCVSIFLIITKIFE